MATSKLISDVEFEEYESSLKTLNDNLEKAESDKDAASNKVEASKKIIKENPGTIATLDKEVTNLNAQVKSLDSKITAAEKANDKDLVASLKAEQKAAQSDIDTKSSESKRLSSELKEAEDNLKSEEDDLTKKSDAFSKAKTDRDNHVTSNKSMVEMFEKQDAEREELFEEDLIQDIDPVFLFGAQTGGSYEDQTTEQTNKAYNRDVVRNRVEKKLFKGGSKESIKTIISNNASEYGEAPQNETSIPSADKMLELSRKNMFSLRRTKKLIIEAAEEGLTSIVVLATYIDASEIYALIEAGYSVTHSKNSKQRTTYTIDWNIFKEKGK